MRFVTVSTACMPGPGAVATAGRESPLAEFGADPPSSPELADPA